MPGFKKVARCNKKGKTRQRQNFVSQRCLEENIQKSRDTQHGHQMQQDQKLLQKQKRTCVNLQFCKNSEAEIEERETYEKVYQLVLLLKNEG